MDLSLLGLILICAAVVAWKTAHNVEQKKRAEETTSMTFESDKERGLLPLRRLYAQHPDIIPAVPHGVSALEFGGWFEEAHRRLELWAVGHRSAADMALRIQLQKQINELEEEHLRYGRTQSEILLLQHRHEAEIAKLQLQKQEAEDQTEQIRERAAQRKNPPQTYQAPSRQSHEERFFAEWKRLRDQRKHRLADCGGDQKCEEMVNLYFDNEEEKLKEGR